MSENTVTMNTEGKTLNEETVKKRRRTSAERIADLAERQARLAEEQKKLNAQKRKAKLQKNEEDRKARTHKLCQIGGLVEKYLDRPIEERDIERFEAYLKRCKGNNESFQGFMNGTNKKGNDRREENANRPG